MATESFQKPGPVLIGNEVKKSFRNLINAYTDKGNAVSQLRELENKNEPFGKLPRSFLDCPQFFNLTEQELKVFTCYLIYRNGHTGISRPTQKHMLKNLQQWKKNFSKKSLERTTKSLKKKGFIYVAKRSGYKSAAEYFIAMNEEQRAIIEDIFQQP